MKKILVGLSLVSGLVGCASKEVTPDYRYPAADTSGVGDIGSSTDGTQIQGKYKLPITRDGQKKTRLAYNDWSGEWPHPVIVVGNAKSGNTTIQGFASARDLTTPQSCTIKNGIYHPWSQNSPSLINYYTFIYQTEFIALQDMTYDKVKVPKGARLVDMVPSSEGWVGITVVIGKSKREIELFGNDLYDPMKFKQVLPTDDFWEQWLHMQCSEMDNGK
ncbi:MAG: hypothetical protein J7501_17835, partial [Bdellovibrio sp.]|nr:hypothetical protein [Bdellovibrio sp.]